MRKLFLLFLFLIGISIFSLPKWGSTKWKRQIELHIENQIGGKCEVEAISLNWTGSQSCHGVKWHDSTKGLSLEADSVIIYANLIDSIHYREKPLQFKLEGATLDLKEGMKWIKKKPKDLHIAFSTIEATLDQGKLSYQRIDLEINNKMRAYTWGVVDLNQENLAVTLGLPQKMLVQIFKEFSFLPKDFLLEIPISCNFSVDSVQKKLFWYLLENYAIVTSLHK